MAELKRRTKTILTTYAMLDSDSGLTLICDKGTDFTITLQSPTGRHYFDVLVVNIGVGLVTIGGQVVRQYSHAHVTNKDGVSWVVAIGGGAETDPVFLASVAYGIIAQDLVDWDEAHTKATMIPVGGAEDQVLAKKSNADYDGKWMNAPAAINGLPSGGNATEILEKIDGTDYNTRWATKPTGGGGSSVGGTIYGYQTLGGAL